MINQQELTPVITQLRSTDVSDAFLPFAVSHHSNNSVLAAAASLLAKEQKPVFPGVCRYVRYIYMCKYDISRWKMRRLRLPVLSFENSSKPFYFFIININKIIYIGDCNECRKSSPLFFLDVHRTSVGRQRRLDSLPTIGRPNDVRRSTMKEPHRHLENSDSGCGPKIFLNSASSL